jgi:hypothetical protein
MTELVEVTPQERKTFNPDEVPLYYDVAKRVNAALVDMAQKGVIKYGEKGELKGKIRLDLGKTFPYYAELDEKDPLVGYTIKSAMDDWRESHTGRTSWWSANKMFGISHTGLLEAFKGTSDCARESLQLEAEEKAAWDKHYKAMGLPQTSLIRTEIGKTLGEDVINISKDDFRRMRRAYLDEWIQKTQPSGRVANSLRNYYDKNFSVKTEEGKAAQHKYSCDFWKDKGNLILKDQFKPYLIEDKTCTSQSIRSNAIDVIFHKNPDNVEIERKEIEISDKLEKEYQEKKQQKMKHDYEPPCEGELNSIKKETETFCDWVSKQVVQNLWRE